MRRADNMDYSHNIIEFLKQQRRQRSGASVSGGDGNTLLETSEFPQKKMEETKLGQIRFRCGPSTRYIYSHHGCCEHKIAIADIRCVHDSDIRERNMYPLLTLSRRSFYSKTCSVCEEAATWTVRNDRTAPMADTNYFCDDCHRILHRKGDGSLKVDANTTVTPFL